MKFALADPKIKQDIQVRMYMIHVPMYMLLHESVCWPMFETI